MKENCEGKGECVGLPFIHEKCAFCFSLLFFLNSFMSARVCILAQEKIKKEKKLTFVRKLMDELNKITD